MSVVIQGVEYFSHREVADRIGIHRSTLTRWKRDGSVPEGRRFPRGKQVVYTATELAEIEDFAFRLEPTSLDRTMPSIP